MWPNAWEWLLTIWNMHRLLKESTSCLLDQQNRCVSFAKEQSGIPMGGIVMAVNCELYCMVCNFLRDSQCLGPDRATRCSSEQLLSWGSCRIWTWRLCGITTRWPRMMQPWFRESSFNMRQYGWRVILVPLSVCFSRRSENTFWRVRSFAVCCLTTSAVTGRGSNCSSWNTSDRSTVVPSMMFGWGRRDNASALECSPEERYLMS